MIVTNSVTSKQFELKCLVLEFESPVEVDGFYAIFNTSIIADIARDYGLNPHDIRENIHKMYPETNYNSFHYFVLGNGKFIPQPTNK